MQNKMILKKNIIFLGYKTKANVVLHREKQDLLVTRKRDFGQHFPSITFVIPENY